MIDPDLAVRPPRVPEARFASVTPEQISTLVDDFYGAIRADARLGPIFDGVIGDNWPTHMLRMKSFWRSVLLKTGEYGGRPVPAHMAIPDLKPDDFQLWLALFEEVSGRVMDAQTAPHVQDAARRIARSLWMARFASPLDPVPQWLTETG